MRTSPFLTEIARDYEDAIEYVSFRDLKGELGLARFRRGVEWYAIEIDRDRLPCIYRVLFTFFHEVGHVVRRHFNCTNLNGGYSLIEQDADLFALKQMGMLDGLGKVKRQCELCCRCMKTRSKVCLKGRESSE
jgi:hypothetical protein